MFFFPSFPHFRLKAASKKGKLRIPTRLRISELNHRKSGRGAFVYSVTSNTGTPKELKKERETRERDEREREREEREREGKGKGESSSSSSSTPGRSREGRKR